MATRTLKNLNIKSAILETPIQVLANRAMYVILLLAFLVIGYLLGSVFPLRGSVLGANTVGTAPTPAPQAPGTPPTLSAEEVNKKLTLGHFPVKGNANAKVTIVEFADFRCPFCEKFYTDTEPQILKDYVDTGKAKFVFRNYAFLGPASVVAANAAECANDQGKFWDMYDYLYKNQPDESDISMYVTDKLSAAAGTLGMNASQFSSCLDAKTFDKRASDDLAEGQAVGVSGTPTFYINGKQLVGALPYATIKAAIDEELKK